MSDQDLRSDLLGRIATFINVPFSDIEEGKRMHSNILAKSYYKEKIAV